MLQSQAKFTEIYLCLCLSSQPFQSGTPSPQSNRFQVEPHCRAGRVASALFSIDSGVWRLTEIRSNSSDSTGRTDNGIQFADLLSLQFCQTSIVYRVRGILRSGQGAEYIFPDTALCPAKKAVVERLLGAVDLARAIGPATTVLQRGNDPAQHTTVIHPRLAPAVRWQERLDPCPLCIRKPERIRLAAKNDLSGREVSGKPSSFIKKWLFDG